jgi:hypothetical protein
MPEGIGGTFMVSIATLGMIFVLYAVSVALAVGGSVYIGFLVANKIGVVLVVHAIHAILMFIALLLVTIFGGAIFWGMGFAPWFFTSCIGGTLGFYAFDKTFPSRD